MFNHGFLMYIWGFFTAEQNDMLRNLIDGKELNKRVGRPYVGYFICEECLVSIANKVHPHGEAIVEADWERDEHGWEYAPLPERAKKLDDDDDDDDWSTAGPYPASCLDCLPGEGTTRCGHY